MKKIRTTVTVKRTIPKEGRYPESAVFPGIRKTLFVIALIIFIARPKTLSAYKANGHELIEALGYKLLLEMQPVDIAQHYLFKGEENDKAPSGKEILIDLIKRKYIDYEYQFVTGKKYLIPRIGSGVPDYVTTRQFSSNGQAFHFMALPVDIRKSKGIPEINNTPFRLTGSAYHRSIELMSGMMNDIMSNLNKARDLFRGPYTVMHIIQDSYCSAHTERDPGNGYKILYLKPWRITGFIDYLFHPCSYCYNYKHFFGKEKNHHYAFQENRDRDYINSDIQDSGLKIILEKDSDYFYRYNPFHYTKEELLSYLSPSAQQAAKSVRDYLITLWLIDRMDITKKRIIGVPFNETDNYGFKYWNRYLNTHMQSAYQDMDLKGPVSGYQYNESESWMPDFNLGVQLRKEDRTLVLNGFVAEFYYTFFNSFQLLRNLSPFFMGFILEYDYDFVSINPLTIKIGLSENLAIGLKPLTISRHNENIKSDTLSGIRGDSLYENDELYKRDLIFSFSGKLDLFLEEFLWLSIESPRFIHHGHQFDGYWRISAGIATDFYMNPFNRSTKRVLSKPLEKKEIPDDYRIKETRKKSVFDFDLIYFAGGWSPGNNRADVIGAEIALNQFDWNDRTGFRIPLFGYSYYYDTDQSNRDSKMRGHEFWLGLGYFLVDNILYLGYKPVIVTNRFLNGIKAGDTHYHSSWEARLYLSTLLISCEIPVYNYTDKEGFKYDDRESFILRIGLSPRRLYWF